MKLYILDVHKNIINYRRFWEEVIQVFSKRPEISTNLRVPYLPIVFSKVFVEFFGVTLPKFELKKTTIIVVRV